MAKLAPYGSWKSPITSELLTENVVSLGYPSLDGDTLYWLEGRPSEGGRQVIVRRLRDGQTSDVLPEPFSARSLVHEYGGLAHVIHDGTIYFVNYSDQRLYRRAGDGTIEAITPPPPSSASVRYAGPIVSPSGTWVICVRERHLNDGVVNDLVAIDAGGNGEARVLAEGNDFFSAAVISPQGDRLAWTSWDHPNMPWDGTELYEGVFGRDASLSEVRLVAGGKRESVTQARYSPQGVLHFVSDRTGWWNLYRDDGSGPRALPAMEAEFATPDWVFGLSNYTFAPDGRLVASWTQNGLSQIGRLSEDGGHFVEIPTSYQYFAGLTGHPDGVLAIAGSAKEATALVKIDVEQASVEVLARSRKTSVDAQYLSVAVPIEYPNRSGLSAHALYYPPQNPDFVAPESDRPPLIVSSHGGPTSSALPVLSYAIQFWTSRGFAVVDVDYGGSSGYGREYRERLRGNWGIVDVDDCVDAAEFLARRGDVDHDAMVIHGGSAGGYTTLCALTFRTVFAAGASYFGVADAAALARDTHKFESRYLDGMIGPWPEAAAIYEQRSPIFHVEELSTPLILFQGLEDKIVPPNQAEMMFEALKEKGAAVAYIAYPDEQHGFRRAENIRRTAEAELYFYGKVLGFAPADDIEPVQIENLGSADSDASPRGR